MKPAKHDRKGRTRGKAETLEGEPKRMCVVPLPDRIPSAPLLPAARPGTGFARFSKHRRGQRCPISTAVHRTEYTVTSRDPLSSTPSEIIRTGMFYEIFGGGRASESRAEVTTRRAVTRNW